MKNRFSPFIPSMSLLVLAAGSLMSGCQTQPEPESTGVQEASDIRAWDEPRVQPHRIILTWEDDPATTQSVTWRTNASVTTPVAEVALATPHPGMVNAGVRTEARSETVDASIVDGEYVVAKHHTATFRDLLPDTLYAYRVGDGETWSEWFQFRTASTEPKPFSFVYFGDAQNDIMPLWSRVIRASALEAPDMAFMLHAGDLVNRAHRNTEWGERFEAGSFLHAMFPSIAALGNHETDPYNAEEDAQDIEHISIWWQPQFAFPNNGPQGVDGETVYYVDYQGVRIVALNSSDDWEIQAEWLDRILTENPHDWVIVTHHHPIFSASEGRDNQELRNTWKPIYDKHGVDLVLQGHDHTYARGRTPTYAAAASENVPTGANLRDGENGTVYVVSVGAVTIKNNKPDGRDGYEEIQRERAAENTQLFQVIRIDGHRLFYQAFTPTGQLYDAFELEKQEGRPNRFIDGAPETDEYRFQGTDPYTW